MMRIVVVFSVVIFLVSTFLLLRRRNKCGKLGFLYLLWLHAIIGSGYVFMAVYDKFELGPPYPNPFRLGSPSDTAYWYTLVISLSLLVLNGIWYKSDKVPQSFRLPRLKSLRPRFLIAVLLMLPIYLAGLQFNTLGVGLELNYALPFRLNGVIEITILFLLPFCLAILSLGSRKNFLVGMVMVGFYSLYNLVSFGSKFAALYPVVIFGSVHFVLNRLNWRTLLGPFVLMLAAYALLNPYYFRSALEQNLQLSFTEAITKSYHQAVQSAGGVNLLVGLRNISCRVGGLEAMATAIGMTEIYPHPSPFAIKHLNNFFNSGSTSLAPRHFGYFMIATGNHFLGLLLGIVVLGLCLRVAIHFDRIAARDANVVALMVGMAFVLNIFGFLIDGRYAQSSNYLHLIFSMVVVRFLFAKQRSPRSRPGASVVSKGECVGVSNAHPDWGSSGSGSQPDGCAEPICARG